MEKMRKDTTITNQEYYIYVKHLLARKDEGTYDQNKQVIHTRFP